MKSKSLTSPERLPKSVQKVVDADTCSGCGACTQLWPELEMRFDERGFLRPEAVRAVPTSSELTRRFRKVCPGVSLVAPPHQSNSHWLFGKYEKVWQANASDPEIRHAGSSGGVLTALAAAVVASGSGTVIGAASASQTPARTVPVRITSRAEALAASGSRYAPVGVLAAPGVLEADAIISKPCEAAAVRGLSGVERVTDPPLLLSFFCAGTPSQGATTRVLASRGIKPDELASLRYRGNGWPGDFVGETRDGREARVSYDDSWGKFLGRDLQNRCKICVDGTGELADVAVGDYWHADASGYPIFADAPASSVVIARTRRGRLLVERAIAEGIIEATPLDLERVVDVQPLQRDRRRTLAGRLVGRFLSGRPIPRYRGFQLTRVASRNVRATARAALGMLARSLRPQDSITARKGLPE